MSILRRTKQINWLKSNISIMYLTSLVATLTNFLKEISLQNYTTTTLEQNKYTLVRAPFSSSLISFCQHALREKIPSKTTALFHFRQFLVKYSNAWFIIKCIFFSKLV